MARSGWCQGAWCRRAGCCPSASRSTTTWCTSPTRAIGGSNYTGFRLRDDGRLRLIAGSAVALLGGSQPGDVLFNADGSTLAGTRIGTSLIDSFTVGDDGRLAAAPGSAFPGQGLGPFGSEFRPTNPDQLFVSRSPATGSPLAAR